MESERNKTTHLTVGMISNTSLESHGSKKEYSTIQHPKKHGIQLAIIPISYYQKENLSIDILDKTYKVIDYNYNIKVNKPNSKTPAVIS